MTRALHSGRADDSERDEEILFSEWGPPAG
jgi:hypothetical protein